MGSRSSAYSYSDNVLDRTGTSYNEIVRTAFDTYTTLTGVETQSDAWGKNIPITFGRTRVPGALVWASEFYKTTSGFDTSVKIHSLITTVYTSQNPNDPFPTKTDETIIDSPQVTRDSISSTSIDLCYSFGKDGDRRRKRYVDIVRINDVEVYNNRTKYIAPSLGFSIRYGYEDGIDPLMAKYPDGNNTYKGQTLIIFNRFPTGDFGNAIPKSIDVEFGCVTYDGQDDDGDDNLPVYPCAAVECGYKIDLDRRLDRALVGNDKIAPGEVKWTKCNIIVVTIGRRPGDTDELEADNQLALEGTTPIASIGWNGTMNMYLKVVTEAEATEYNKKGVQILTPYKDGKDNLLAGRVRVIQLPDGWGRDGKLYQDPSGTHIEPWQVEGPALVFRDVLAYASNDGSSKGAVTTKDPIIDVAGPAFMQIASHTSVIAGPSIGTDGDAVEVSGVNYLAAISHRFTFKAC